MKQLGDGHFTHNHLIIWQGGGGRAELAGVRWKGKGKGDGMEAGGVEESGVEMEDDWMKNWAWESMFSFS